MIVSEKPRIELLNCDCMECMANCPDKAFDLAIVDPPYGIGESNKQRATNAKSCPRWKNCGNVWQNYKKKDWDAKVPSEEYFQELFRISRNQIIWGGNFFNLGATSCILVWDKLNGESDFADGELAWTSFNSSLRIFKYLWSGFNKEIPEKRFHPTQKPIKLYKWLLKNYAKPGDKIFDSHGGSMSIAIACHRMGFDLTLCEIDKDYYNAGVKRFKEQTQQIQLFKNEIPNPINSINQLNLL